MNHYSSSSLPNSTSDGACSPLNIETPGFSDLISEITTEDGEERRSSVDLSETTAAEGTGNAGGLEAHDGACSRTLADFGRTNRRAEPSRSDDDRESVGDAGRPAGAERQSNCTVPPPNSQIEQVSSSPRFDDVLQSLMRLINDCKDKKTMVSKETLSARLPIVRQILSGSPSHETAEAGPSNRSPVDPGKFVLPDGRVCDLRPVCEIRPFLNVDKMAAAVRDGGGRARRRVDRPERGRSTRRARQPRRNGRFISVRDAEADAAEAVAVAGVDNTETAVEALMAADRPPASRSGRPAATATGAEVDGDGGDRRSPPRRERRGPGPSFAEDGLEIIEELERQGPAVDDEAAAAAASLLDLDLF